MVVVEKRNGDLDICIDPNYLNDGIKMEHYPILKKDDIIPEMNNAKIFTKLDASQGFWQIKLNEGSSKLTTFNTPFGINVFVSLLAFLVRRKYSTG